MGGYRLKPYGFEVQRSPCVERDGGQRSPEAPAPVHRDFWNGSSGLMPSSKALCMRSMILYTWPNQSPYACRRKAFARSIASPSG